MKTLWHVGLVLLFLFAVGCSDESLVGVAENGAPFDTETALSVPARIGMMDAASIYGVEPVAAMAESDMVLFMGEGSFSEVSETGEIIRCRDADGNRVPGLFVFAAATVTGRFFFLDDMTGFFTRDRCLIDGQELALEGSWTFTGTEAGEAVWGSYTATVSLADGSFTHKEIIADGTGRFDGATGWLRGIGSIPQSGIGDGMFYGKGLITHPQEVTTQGIVMDASVVSEEGNISCVDPNGESLPIDAVGQFNLVGVATYLGHFTGALVNERCEVSFRGFTTFSGTWMLTGADGTTLRGTYIMRVPESLRTRVEMIVTEGTGLFEGASGWVGGVGRARLGALKLPLEGLIFLPR